MRNPLLGLRPAVPGASRKRVLVMVGTEYAHSRAILTGTGDYEDHHGRWQYVFETHIGPGPVQRGEVDGMIVELRDHATYEAVQRTPIPAVIVTGVIGPQGPLVVTHDNHAVGRMGADYLADLGLRTLAFVSGEPTAAFAQHRAEGFAAVCAARRLPCLMPEPALTLPRDEAALGSWIRALPKPVGILASTDRVAFGVSRLCNQLAIAVPEQVALLGVDDEVEICRLADPPLSSIDHGSRRIGYEAAKLLDRWMTTGQRPERSLLIQPAGVISRRSTDLLAVGDPDVAAALRFIRSHATEAIKVRDVLKHVAASRRMLELRFRRAIGRTIHDEIMRVRIERAKHLLITSDWQMPEIADACGFAFASQFSHVFRRETGLPPLAFRRHFRYHQGDPAPESRKPV